MLSQCSGSLILFDQTSVNNLCFRVFYLTGFHLSPGHDFKGQALGKDKEQIVFLLWQQLACRWCNPNNIGTHIFLKVV